MEHSAETQGAQSSRASFFPAGRLHGRPALATLTKQHQKAPEETASVPCSLEGASRLCDHREKQAIQYKVNTCVLTCGSLLSALK